MRDTKSKIIKDIENSRADIIRFAQELARANSENPYLPNESWKINKPIEKRCARLISKKLKNFGFAPKFISALSNRPNVMCSLKSKTSKPCLIFNGHMDVVPAGDIKKWKYPPFAGKIVGNKLYGRGVLDMKSSLVAMIFAMKSLRQIDLAGNLIFTGVVDEEPGACSEIGTKCLLKKGLKGDACIVGEPKTERIYIGAKGYYRFKIITKGKAVSTGSGVWERKEKGINAVMKMAKILLELEKFNSPAGELKYKFPHDFKTRKPVITPGVLIKGGTGINIVPNRCEAMIDIRLMPRQTKQQVKKEITKCIKKLQRKDKDIKIEIQDLGFVPAVCISKNEKIVKILGKNANLILKRKPDIGFSPSCCDAHFFIHPPKFSDEKLRRAGKGIPTICGFGPDGDNFHSANEFVYINSIIDICKIYALTAYDFLK